jgi:hypothetical protein
VKAQDIPWLGGTPPPTRREAHYGDRVIECFAERPAGLFELFADATRRNPHGEAIVFEQQRASWRELERQVTNVAASSGPATASACSSATGRNSSSQFLPPRVLAPSPFRSASGSSATRLLMR